MKLLVVMTSAIVVLLVSGCGVEDEELSLFSTEDAEVHLKRWVEAVFSQDIDKLMECSGTPFRFRSRTWTSAAEAKANLALQLAGLKEQMEKALRDGGSFRYFSHRDLKDGQFPERAQVSEERREVTISRLGVRREGFIAWLHVGRQSILKLILNAPSSRDRLVVEGVDPR